MITRTTLAVSLLLISALAHGQQAVTDVINKNMPKPVPQSPNVASLGKFGDYQVSHFSGLPQISIPLYEVKSGSLSVPITLSYHASGVKPTDVASWVGMGWSLSAGGQISRSVSGKPDEQHYSYSELQTGPSNCGNYSYLQLTAQGTYDADPDVFSYSFGSKSGKFMMAYNGSPFLIPYAPVKVATPYGFPQFDITDEGGVLHRFGRNSQGVPSTETTTATNGGNPSFNAVTAWHLAEMIAPNSNDRIDFSYQAVGTFYTHDISHSYSITDFCTASNGASCPGSSPIANTHNVDSYGNQLGLSSITFEHGRVDFVLSGSQRADASSLKYLDRIEVRRSDNSLVKTIKFIYSYFSNGATANAALKLNEVRFLDANSAIVEVYKAEYHTNSFSWNPNNAAYLNARDMWGYYNGATSNTNLILPTTVSYQDTPATTPGNVNFGGATDRSVNGTMLKEGVLKKIIFPTGGYTEFDYEPNKYLDGQTLKLAGGLRVTTIKSFDGSGGVPILKTYKYGLNESGYGIANFTPSQFNYSTTQHYYQACEVHNPMLDYRIRSFHSTTAFTTDMFDASPVLYPYVTEYFGDPSGVHNGKIVYEFDSGTPSMSTNLVVPGSGKYYRNSTGWKRGKLTKRTTFDKVNNKLAESIIQYTMYQSISKYVGIGVHEAVTGTTACAPSPCLNEFGDLVGSNTHSFTSYYQDSGALLESQVDETTYVNGDVARNVSKVTNTTYESAYLQPVETAVTTSTSAETLVNKFKYPFSYTFSGSETGAAGALRTLRDQNVITPIETTTFRRISGTDKIVGGQLNTFIQNAANPVYIVPDVIYNLEVGPNASFSASQISGNNLTRDSKYKAGILLAHDAQGNILQAQKANDLVNSYQWGYANSLPVSEVKNAGSTASSSQSTTTISIARGGAAGANHTETFSVAYAGTVTFKMGVNSNPNYTTTVNYSFENGTGPSGSMQIGNGSCGNTAVNFSLAAGTHTIIFYFSSPGQPYLGGCGELIVPSYNTSTYTESFFQGFEEGAYTAGASHSGSKYLTGDYTTTFTKPNSRSYLVEYWYLDGSVWQYANAEYSNGMTLTAGSAIDDVRFYPRDAFMTNYNYDPLLGITSVVDENGKVTTYEYDSYGRLMHIKNEKGGIEKRYSYNYKQ